MSRPRPARVRLVLLCAGLALPVACGGAGSTDPVEVGRRAYLANCIACHHMDPAREGSLGPPIAGSSRALIEARVLHARYPEGYTPKRDSSLMPAQPFLRKDLPALAAYLGSLPAE